MDILQLIHHHEDEELINTPFASIEAAEIYMRDTFTLYEDWDPEHSVDFDRLAEDRDGDYHVIIRTQDGSLVCFEYEGYFTQVHLIDGTEFDAPCIKGQD